MTRNYDWGAESGDAEAAPCRSTAASAWSAEASGLARRDFIGEEAKATQRRTLLQALQQGSVSTIDARERLGIAHPAGRKMELLRQGWPIVTRRGSVLDAAGRSHVSAIYALCPAPSTDGAA